MTEHIRNCKLCQRPMKYSAFYMCQECLLELDKVSSYIKHHPFATVAEISQGTRLSADIIQRIIDFFLRQGRHVHH